ncbi:MAG TPA: hypothetical protein VF559_09455 [Caulobacteraceae bacterium]|jgi:hypothetical protein
MADFSLGKALGAGFTVIRRKPAAPLIWGLLYAPLMLGPILITMIVPQPDTSATATPQEALGRIWVSLLPLLMLQPFLLVGSIVVQAMLQCAIFRSVLEPQNSRRFYLALGPQELWVGLAQFCLGFVLMVPMFGALAVVLPAGVGVYFAAGGGHQAIAPVAVYAVIAGLAVLALTLWVFVRFSMAAPMAFADRNFRLLESWPLTRGHAGRLMLLGLLVMAMVIGAYAVLALVVGASTLMAVFTATALAAFNGGADGRTVGAGVIFFFGVFAVLSGYLWAITVAPWADAFRQLRAGQIGTAAPAGA